MSSGGVEPIFAFEIIFCIFKLSKGCILWALIKLILLSCASALFITSACCFVTDIPCLFNRMLRSAKVFLPRSVIILLLVSKPVESINLFKSINSSLCGDGNGLSLMYISKSFAKLRNWKRLTPSPLLIASAPVFLYKSKNFFST